MKISKIKNVSLEANEEYVFDLVNDLVANSVEDSVYLQVLEDANITVKVSQLMMTPLWRT